MGQMRFRLADRNRIPEGGLDRIFIAGSEEIPWSTRAAWVDDHLVVERLTSDSGIVSVPWVVEGHGPSVLTTATLIERARPYTLDVELARGLIQRLRIQLGHWELLGLETPDALQQQLQAATTHFSRAATSQNDLEAATTAANQAIATAMEVAEKLTESYAQQALAGRGRQGQIATLMGVALDDDMTDVETRRQLVESCNLVQLPISWRAIEAREGRRDWQTTDAQLAWSQKAGIKVAAGPLLQMDDWGVPDWIYLWEGDFDNISRLLIDHVQSVVSRYAGRVHLWHVSSRVNTGKFLSLTEEQRLHLVAQALDVVRQIDGRTPAVVSFDQPWAEYLAGQDEDLAPLHYADALVRADLGVSGFGLEINAGFYPGGSAHRPTFELGRLIDRWSIWNLPLMVTLTTASRAADDPLARKSLAVDLAPGAKQKSSDPQRDWAASILPLLFARNAVQVILWNQLTDATPHELPHAGLFDAKGTAKPIVSLMRDLRKSLLA